MLTISKKIKAAPNDVFQQLADFYHAADRIDHIKSLEVLTDGPIGVGTRFRETREMFGKDCTEEMEVTQFDAPHSYTVEADSCGARMISRFDVEADNDGSVVHLSLESRPTTLFAKIASPITGLLFRGVMRKCLESDLECIKQSIEESHGGSHTAPIS